MTERTFSNKVALITGASAGIGLEVARQLVQRGSKVALVARTQSKLDAAVAELGAEHAHAFSCDVSDRARVTQLPAQVRAHFGRLDFVINNAGTHHRGSFLERSAEEIAEMVETNLTAPLLLTRAAVPLLEPAGVVVNVASLAGKVPVPRSATYSGSKFGLRAFARALDFELELAGSSVKIATVSPGPVDTGFFGDDLDSVTPITFSQPMSSATEVAAAVLEALAHPDRIEIDVPGPSGALATLGYLSPRIYRALHPLMHKLGERGKRRYADTLRSRR